MGVKNELDNILQTYSNTIMDNIDANKMQSLMASDLAILNSYLRGVAY